MTYRVTNRGLSLFCYCCRFRCYSSGQPGESVMNVFDRKAKRRQKNRAAMAEDVAVYDYLKDEVSGIRNHQVLHVCTLRAEPPLPLAS